MATDAHAEAPDPAALDSLNDSTAPVEVRRMAAELLPLFYEQLRRIARGTRRRSGGSHTMQTTALVHEAYLRLGQERHFADDKHFLRSAALAMRHALINHADARRAEKRGSGAVHVTLSHAVDFAIATDEGLLALHEAMQRLETAEPRLSHVVECRFFGGYNEEDTARALDLSIRTVQRDWIKARAWLLRELTRVE